MSQPHQVYKYTKLDNITGLSLIHVIIQRTKLDNITGLSLIYVIIQRTFDKVGIGFQWENNIMHPFPSVMPRVLKFREKFK